MQSSQSAFHLVLSAVFLLAIPLAQAVEKPEKQPTNHVATVPVPEGLSAESTEKAIIMAAIGRRWTIQEKSNGKVVLHLVHRGFDSTLTLLYTIQEIKIYSDSWTIKKSGTKKKRKDPEGWIGNLQKDLPVFMNRELYQ